MQLVHKRLLVLPEDQAPDDPLLSDGRLVENAQHDPPVVSDLRNPFLL